MIIKNYKQIHDTIHGFMKISNLACKIIDTPQFQRLRYLHQLGTCHYVFPNATHTRFEHSLGTYHLAGRLLDSIKLNTSPKELNRCLSLIKELSNYYIRTYGDKPHHKLDDYVCELVKISALCHDLGHGPFSHVFDDVFIPMMRNLYNKEIHPLEKHENRSCLILEHIIKSDRELSRLIHKDDILFMKSLINPGDGQAGFIYQIVSNNLNSVDVDKYDYIARDTYFLGLKFGFDCSRLISDAKVIDNIICYPEQIYYEVASIFKTRYRLHKQTYSHKIVIAIQYMINDMMALVDPVVNIYDSIFDMKKFCELTDDYVVSTVKFLNKTVNKHGYSRVEVRRIAEAHDIWTRINLRLLYRFIGTMVSDKPIRLNFKHIWDLDKSIDQEAILTHKAKIGFVSGKTRNPFKELYFYKNKDPNRCYKIRKEDISFLIPNTYQEYIYMVFVKDRNNIELVNRLHRVFGKLENIVKN